MDAVIAGDGLTLRIWRRSDYEALTVIIERSQPEFADWLPGVTHDLADLAAFFDHVETAYAAGTGFFYAIEEGGQAVGQCSLHHRDPGTAEIGYWVRTDCTGRGLATRAVTALAAAAFADGVGQLVIHCDEGNARSAAVARKAGFTHVKTVQLDPTLPRTRTQSGREMTWLRRAQVESY